MCEAKPGLRCATHLAGDYLDTKASYERAFAADSTLSDAQKFRAQLAWEQREREVSLLALKEGTTLTKKLATAEKSAAKKTGEAKAKEEAKAQFLTTLLARHQALMLLKEEGSDAKKHQVAELEREAELATAAGAYLRSRGKDAPLGTRLPARNEDIVALFDFMAAAHRNPDNHGKRPAALTPEEEQARADAQGLLDAGEEFSSPEAKEAWEKKQQMGAAIVEDPAPVKAPATADTRAEQKAARDAALAKKREELARAEDAPTVKVPATPAKLTAPAPVKPAVAKPAPVVSPTGNKPPRLPQLPTAPAAVVPPTSPAKPEQPAASVEKSRAELLAEKREELARAKQTPTHPASSPAPTPVVSPTGNTPNPAPASAASADTPVITDAQREAARAVRRKQEEEAAERDAKLVKQSFWARLFGRY